MRFLFMIAVAMYCSVVSINAPRLDAGESRSALDSKWIADRDANRKGREGLYQDAAADRIARAKKATGVLEDVVEAAMKMRVTGQDAHLASMIAFIERLDAKQATAAKELLKKLPPEPTMSLDKDIKNWERTFKSKSASLTKPTKELAEKALKYGVTDIAFDCFQQVLKFDPDNASLRQALNQKNVDGRYYGPKDMVYVKAGLRWDNKLGWIVEKDKERYKNGDYFDVQSKKWTTLKEVNGMRSSPDNQWVLLTEHLEIRGTAKIQELVEAANKLEQLYSQIFASYSSFFSNGKNDVRLIFGALDHERLVINIAKDPDAYRASLPEGVPAGFSAGMWVPAKGASYFYAGPLGVMYHEFTHQVLDVFSGGSRGEVWVIEGVAVYTQAPTFVDGELVLGDISENGHIKNHLRRAKSGESLPLDKLMALNHQTWSSAKDPGANYGAAGALAQFCMEANNRRYRFDYVDFVRDSYLGKTDGHKIWEYLGMSKDEFESNYKTWEKDMVK